MFGSSINIVNKGMSMKINSNTRTRVRLTNNWKSFFARRLCLYCK